MVLEEEGAMFTADNVLGVGTAVFSDLGLYIDSLERMRGAALALGSKYVKLYTGHGPHIENGVSVLGDYIEHRMARVRQVAMLLEDAGDGRDWSAEEVTRCVICASILPIRRMGLVVFASQITLRRACVVSAIYDGVPEKLIMPATGVTQLVLRKLRDDGSSAIGIGLALRNLAKNWRSIGERYIGDHRKYRPVAPNRPAP
jgi:hypothetical protein